MDEGEKDVADEEFETAPEPLGWSEQAGVPPYAPLMPYATLSCVAVSAHRHSRLVSKEKALPCVSRSPLLELAPEESHEPLALALEVPLFMRARA